MTGGVLGKVTHVTEKRAGTELARDHVAGVTTLELEDIGELPGTTGRMSIGFGVYAFTRDDAEDPDVDELGIEETPEPDDGTVTIDPALVGAWEEGTPALLYPTVTERVAYVFLEEQQEEIPARVDWSLYGTVDRLPTGTREDPEDAETVVLVREDDEYIVRDVVGEPGQGLARETVVKDAAIAIPHSAVYANPVVLATIPLDIPSEDHRVVLSYFANFASADAGTALSIALDDAGFDFSVSSELLATYNPDLGVGNDALALIPGGNQGTGWVRPDGALGAIATLTALPGLFMPYVDTKPSPGLHIFRLVGYVQSGPGAGTIDTVRLWGAVI